MSNLPRSIAGIVALTVVGALVGTLGAQGTAPVYRAKATVLVSGTRAATPDSAAQGGLSSHDAFFDTEASIVRSQAVAESAVDRLKLVQRGKEGTAPSIGQERYSLATILRDAAS